MKTKVIVLLVATILTVVLLYFWNSDTNWKKYPDQVIDISGFSGRVYDSSDFQIKNMSIVKSKKPINLSDFSSRAILVYSDNGYFGEEYSLSSFPGLHFIEPDSVSSFFWYSFYPVVGAGDRIVIKFASDSLIVFRDIHGRGFLVLLHIFVAFVIIWACTMLFIWSKK